MKDRLRFKLLFFVATVTVVIWLFWGAKLVYAGEVTLSWTNPVEQEQCTNAGPLPDLKGTRIYELVAETTDPALTAVTLTGKLPGEYTYVATAYVLDEEGNPVESRTTTNTVKTITEFKALAGATVYQVVTISNGFWLLPVGTVPVDTACNVNSVVNGKYGVPVDAIEWSPGTSARPIVVVADCE
jgi:hypothetical protein